MSSKLYFEDDSIQLIEISSDKSSIENINTIQSPSTLNKLKKKNKIDSPTIPSTNLSISSSSTSKISDIFAVKHLMDTSKNKLKPIPAPRKLKTLNSSFKKSSVKDDSSIEIHENIEENTEQSPETVDTISGDIQSIFSYKSQNLSYKERLRNRFINIKKQAESSVIHKDEATINKKKKLKEAVEALLQSQESELKSELNKYEQQKSNRNSNEIAYNFFCKENNEKQIETEEKVKESEEIFSDEIVKQSASDFLGINHLESDLIEYILPYVFDYSFSENTVFKNSKNRLRKKDEINSQTRNFEDEGIFKSNITHISKHQLSILEDRLLFDEQRDWFNNENQLRILPDPRLKNSFKPFESDRHVSDFINKYAPPVMYEPAENIINIYDNTLELILHEIKFKHHALFDKEHVLAQKLIEILNEYKNITSENVLNINIKKLDALRSAKNRLEDIIKQSGDCSDNQLERYKKYSAEIKYIREKIYTVSLKERTLKKSILFLWKTLKILRKTQEYSSTTIKLSITKNPVNYNNEKHLWDQNIAVETNEILEERENNYNLEINCYKRKLKQWKAQAKIKDDESEKTNVSGEFLGGKPNKPVQNFNEENIKKEIIEKMNLCLKPPGEPNLEFNLNFNNQISENCENIKENLRRNDVQKTKIFAKLLCNNREICKSKLVNLNDNFILNFNEHFAVKLYKIPKNLTIQIYEQTSQIFKRIICEISLNVPQFSTFNYDAENVVEIFENSEKVTYSHSAIGTGIELDKIINLDELNEEIFSKNSKLFCTGEVCYNLSWKFDKNFETFLETNSKLSSEIIPTLFDIDHLKNWVKIYPDPLDPNNVLFFDYIKNLDHKIVETNYFRLNSNLENLEFCSFDNLENNPRFKLLNLRFKNEIEFKGIQVPNRLKEIPKNIFSDYETRRKNDNIEDNLEELAEENNIDKQRKNARIFLKRTENKILKLNQISKNKIGFKDVLNEDIPSFGSLGLRFLQWWSPKRPLRPTRKQNKQLGPQTNFKELNILVNIIGAIQIPNRTKNEFTNCVRPFATVNFRGQCKKTTVAEGSNPVWNQELTLTVKNKNDLFTLESVKNIQENIIINLFDETVHNLIIDDRLKDNNIHQQLGCNFLGYFEIPFRTLLYNNRVEGTFKFNIPPILLGYERENINNFDVTHERNFDTFLTIFITIQPSISNIERDFKTELESSETNYVEEYISNWEVDYNNAFPQRKFSSFVMNLSGEKCCVTRYFREIKLPELNIEEMTDISLVKYVSLIPFMENSNNGIISDIWLAPEQLLTLMLGSINDHCVLLTCYFLKFNLKAYFLLGYSLIDGFRSYVLVQENQEYFIYDVKTGLKYDIYDNNCPLEKVFCVFNNKNVWANIQPDDRILQTCFDFSKSSDWLQLFNKNISAPQNIQQLSISYSEPSSVLFLQEKIEKKLRKKLMKWRKFSRTTFNHYCNLAFKKILAKLNAKNMSEMQISESPEHFLEIQNLLSSYEITGFAKSFPYTNIVDLIEFLQKTGIYLNDNPNIEFSLSVYAHSYANNVVIIWLFTAILIPKR